MDTKGEPPPVIEETLLGQVHRDAGSRSMSYLVLFHHRQNVSSVGVQLRKVDIKLFVPSVSKKFILQILSENIEMNLSSSVSYSPEIPLNVYWFR